MPSSFTLLFAGPAAGVIGRRTGSKWPLAAGMLLMTQINPGDGYVLSVLPGVILFGVGLTLVVSPVTATVLAAADERRAGIASGVNNAVSRVEKHLSGTTGHRRIFAFLVSLKD